MDTRHKIVEGAQVEGLAAADAILVTGFFDPLLAAHATRLSEVSRQGRPLIVLVTDPPNPLLPRRARAELVASLAVVHRVILADAEDLTALLSRIPPDRVVREEEADLERRAALMRHIHLRHNGCC